jgi:outer membrane immunogenic protein
MNRAKLAVLASTSLCLSFGAAYAQSPRAPVALDPWVGWYAGGNIGYSWGRTTTDLAVLPFGADLDNFGNFAFPGAASSTKSNVNGVIGGVQTGYVGRIAPHWLAGVEADIQWSGQKGSARGGLGGNAPECTSGDCSFLAAHDVTAKLNWFGTFRGRVGVESNGVWVSGTGGFAYGKVSVSGNHSLVLLDNTGAPDVVGVFSTPFSYSQLKGGWTAGLTIEGLIGTSPWRWKVEYLHIDLGTINGGFFSGFFPSVRVNTVRFTDEILRVGFNYKFGGDTPAVGGAMNAFAAYKAPPRAALPAPYLGWTGWYAGVNAGYIDSVGRTNTDAAFFFANSRGAGDASNIAGGATNQFNHRSSGFLGGAQAGYNYQFSPTVVAGLEADIQGTTLRHNWSATLTTGTGPFWVTTTTVSDRLDYLGTVRGRLGVTPTPDLLVYSTGGLAYGGVSSSTAINFNNTGFAVPGSTAGSFSGTRFGWTVGGGGEWKFSPNWSAKLEYLYYDLGSATYSTGGYSVDLGPTSFTGVGIASLATSTTTRFNGNIARVGLNYKFGGGPIVANY